MAAGSITNSSSPQIQQFHPVGQLGFQWRPDLSVSVGFSLVSDSVVEGGYPGGTNIHTGDPLLSSYHDYGGHTQVMPVAPGSSAIDRANPLYCPAADQRELPRPYDGDAVPGAVCDIGAYEHGFWLSFMPSIHKEKTDRS